MTLIRIISSPQFLFRLRRESRVGKITNYTNSSNYNVIYRVHDVRFKFREIPLGVTRQIIFPSPWNSVVTTNGNRCLYSQEYVNL